MAELADTIKAIEDAIVALLIEAAIPEVNGIVLVNEIKSGTIKPPYVRICPETSPIEDSILAHHEYWRFRFSVMAVASSYASQDMGQARQLALKASSAILIDRSLKGTVRDSVRFAWNGDFKKELPENQIFGAAVGIEARTMIKI